MKADLSRGHRPDQKRGQRYRRVLLQQGRLLLDSDLAAMTDAIDAHLRDIATSVGGEAGSPDLGFLITPGPLLASFESLDGIAQVGSPGLFRYHVDHGKQFLEYNNNDIDPQELAKNRRCIDRLPSLHLDGISAGGTVSIALRPSAAPISKLRLWARIPSTQQLNVKIGDLQPQQKVGLGADSFKAYSFDVPAASYSSLTIEVTSDIQGSDPDREAWIGLIEGHETAGIEPRLWVRKGRYLLGGMALELGADQVFPDVSFPRYSDSTSSHTEQAADLDPAVNLEDEPLFVAYLEGWERLITHVEDPGLLEQALGGAVDTCARTRAVGQVKLVRCPSALDTPAKVLDAFRKVKAPAGTLTVSASSQVTAQDPCAIPEVEGYSGGDNRLYRFEVHEGGDIDTSQIKWSRNNGAEVYRVRTAVHVGSVSHIELDPGVDLRDGDLVELLDSIVDVNDAAPASLDASGFTPARRAVGSLYLLREVPGASGRFELLDINPPNAPVDLSYELAQEGVKLRKWHGLLKKATDATLEAGGRAYTVDGIKVTIGGAQDDANAFCPGDYWQHEARRLYANVSGPWVSSPHGPERRYGPLAMLRYKGTRAPLELVCWYKGRFSPLGELDADHVTYDGDKAGSSARTVQEALDEIFVRRDDAAALEWVRITKVIPYNHPTGELHNDASIEASVFADGMKLRCNREVDSKTLGQATCHVVLELPYPFTSDERAYWGQSVIGFQPVKIDGAVGTLEPSPGEHQIYWKPATASAEAFLRTTLFQKMSTDNRGTRVLARLTLKGNFIWAHDDPTRNLDGDTFGIQSVGGQTKVSLPSGDGKRGGDFEMWFWLVPESVTLQSLTIAPAQVSGSVNATGTITLSGGAPSGGVVIALSSNQTAVIVPSQVGVAGGGTTTTFSITSSPVDQNTTATITAQLTGSTSQTAQLTVLPPNKLTQLTLSSSSVTSGAKVTGTVSLDYPAPTGGSLVTLQAQGGGVRTIPANVLVAAGATQATFEIDTLWDGGSPASATITATFAGVSKSVTLSVQPTAPVIQAITLDVDQVIGGASLNGTVTLSNPALATGMDVNLSSNNANVTFTSNNLTTLQLKIAPSSTIGSFSLKTVPVSTDVTATISADSVSDSVVVKATTLSGLDVNPSTLGPGGTATGTVSLNGAAPANITVTLSSSDTTVATVPPSITVPQGSSNATFLVTGMSFIGGNRNTTLTASRGASETRTFPITVNADADAVPTAVSISPDQVTGGAGLSGTVTLNKAASAGGKIVNLSSNHQAVTFSNGATAWSLTVAAGSSSANFSLSTSPVSSDVTVTISAGAGTPATVLAKAPVASSVTLDLNQIGAGDTSKATVHLNGTTAVATTISVSSTNTSAATIGTSPVTVSQGESTATFTVYGAIFYQVVRTTNITATLGITVQAELRVLGPKPKEYEHLLPHDGGFVVDPPREGDISFIRPHERPDVGLGVMSTATIPQPDVKPPPAPENEGTPGEEEPDKGES